MYVQAISPCAEVRSDSSEWIRESSSVFGERCVRGLRAVDSAGRREARAGKRRGSLGVEVGSQKAVKVSQT